jgi:uncharacterized protein YkwD
MDGISRRTVMIAGVVLVRASAVFAAGAKERMTEDLIVEAVNRGRADLAPELPPLMRVEVLDAIARERSEEMAGGAPFDHDDGAGHYPVVQKIRERYSRSGAMGENIMRDFDPTGKVYDAQVFAVRTVKSWFDSEGHRNNILSAAFTHSGVGVAASRTMVYATQVFWGPPMKPGERRRTGF